MVAPKQVFVYLPDGTLDLPSWLEGVKQKYALQDISFIEKTCHLCANSSKGLTTFYGKPCLEQGLEMAEIILELRLDQEAVAAAIITGTNQHQQLSHDVIKHELNERVIKLIDDVAQMNMIKHYAKINPSRDNIHLDRLRKLILAMVSDIRAVLIKLAERVTLLRGIKKINFSERKRLAQETMDIYAPLANRLGLGQLKWELEDLSFHYVEPDIYKNISQFLAEKRKDRENRIQKLVTFLKEHFEKAGIHADIFGRAKHIYSIYSKSQRKQGNYTNIYDYSALRILVGKLEDCYSALSIVHQLWEPISAEFDDYIAYPKPNGYRSIHTAVIGPDEKNLEIQIRTREMNDEAEHGIAAHWLYKENQPHAEGYEEKITFLRQLLAWHKEVLQQEGAPAEKDLLFEDRIYVFTPAGDILDLAAGSTPLDFAYHIHSEIGHRCRGAKINGHIVPLTHALQTGDKIEIITIKNGHPSRDWMNKELGYLTSSRARAKVAQWFKQQDVQTHIEDGKHLLEKELSRSALTNANLEKMAAQFKFKDTDNFLAAIGRGTIRASQIAHSLQSVQKPDVTPPSFEQASIPSGAFNVNGVSDLLTRIAKCCKPIPGDEIIGYITQGRGVSIHKKSCQNIKSFSPRLLQVNWNDKYPGSYYVDLQVIAQNKESTLREITTLLANLKVDLITLNSTINKKINMLFVVITVQLHDLTQLKTLLSQLQQLPHITEVKRLNG